MKPMKNCIAIAGIHTGIGKTIAAAVLTEALGADYWKPVQAGLEERDAETVSSLVSTNRVIHPEAYLLNAPLSPHTAARLDGIIIDHTRFQFPETQNILLVETAGGVMSPMTDTATMADFMAYYQLPALLVVQHYLGSINHTLCSIEALRKRGIKLLGLVVNGPAHEESETFIKNYTGFDVIAHVPQFEVLSREAVKECAAGKKSLLTVLNNRFKH